MPEKYFVNPEPLSPRERADYQAKNLAESLKRSFEKSLTGRELFETVGATPSDVRTAGDLARLPVTRKNDLIELEKTRPYAGFLTVPPEEVNRIFVAPGPIYEPLHTEGLPWFTAAFMAAGFTQGDIVANTFSYHLSPGGLLFHEAIRQCGATAIPVGVGNTEILIRTLLDIKVTGFVGTPSYLLNVIKKAEEMGYPWLEKFVLRKAWFTGEMLTPAIRQTLEQTYRINTSQAYAVSEIGGALAYECKEKNGLHVMDEYIIEIIDPASGLPSGEGETGEIIVTPLANPTWGLFRFGTGDLSSITSSPCPCGRTAPRLTGIKGRVGDAVKVRGLFIVGRQVEAIFAEMKEIERVQLIVDRPAQRDELVIKVELKDAGYCNETLADDIMKKFQAQCQIRPDKIEFVPAGIIAGGGKIIIDMRKWQ
jgi:phenylacetate-CoA ligase